MPGAAAAPAARRAIVVSFDALNERRMLETVSPEAVPAMRALFAEGACADGARPAFPSLTSPGHAAIWTGAYGDVTGIAANSQLTLPRPAHTLLDLTSGYGYDALRAEPIWLSAAAAGRTVYGHHVTQAPFAPGYRSVDGTPDATLDRRRAEAESLLALPRTNVVNGYNREIAGPRAITERVAPPGDAGAWRNVERLGPTVTPRAIAWAVGDDSLHALLYGRERVDRVLVSRTRDAAQGVVAVLAEVERAPLRGRPLARHWSPPLELPVEGGRTYVRARLFEAAPDGSTFLIAIPELQVVEGNRPEVAGAYDAAVRGWYGNSALWLALDGGLGAPLTAGGDGTAELRWLETAELMALQLMRGVEWAWTTLRPALLLDYYAGIDEVDHSALFALTQPQVPGHAAAPVARMREMRDRAWELADLRLAHLRELVAADPNAALFVSGDHGMRPTWRTFRPNVALQAAGLLAVDSTGRIDLARTRALSPNGYWINVNTTAWKGGIVPPAEAARVLDEAERAIRAARDADGRPIVTRTWRPAAGDTLGIGGPVGGDLYYDVIEGYGWTSQPTGPVAGPGRPGGAHGYPSTSPEMRTVLCAAGAAFAPRRVPTARTIDVAPTVSAWLGIRPPADAVGRSLLEVLQGR